MLLLYSTNFQGAAYSCFLVLNHFESNGDPAHSRSNSIDAWKKIIWAGTENALFFKYVHAYGGVDRVIDSRLLYTTNNALEQSIWNVSKRQQQLSKGSFMQETMTTMRKSCVKMIATSVADYKGIETDFLWRHRTTKGYSRYPKSLCSYYISRR